MSDDEYYSDSDTNSDSDSEVVNKKPSLFKPKNVLETGPTIDEEDDEMEQIGGIGDDDDQEDIVSVVSSDDEEEEESEAEEDLEEEDLESKVGTVEGKEGVNKKTKSKKPVQIDLPSDDEDEDYDESYLQKFDHEVTKNYINEFHPECLIHNYDEITKLTSVVRDSNNIIIDPLHRTIPFLTKYEKARILGQRAKQIETGAKPFISVPENVIDGYVIAELELQQKRIPFIIRRPVPGGGFEYWNLRDLEVIAF